MATTTALMTIEEFAAMPDDGIGTELVRGRIVELPPTNYLHGEICGEIFFQFKLIVKRQGSGQVISNDAGVVTRRNPDTVRGPDVAYYSAAKVPPVDQRRRYPDLPPDIVVEVRSPSDRWGEIVQKAGEYMSAGIPVVVVLDPDTRSAHIFEDDRAPRLLGPDDTLTFPGLLDDFAVRVGAIFD